MNSFKKIAFLAALTAASAFTPYHAQAGAMPSEEPSVLDRALQDIETQNREEPVVLMPAEEEVVVEETTVVTTAPPPPEDAGDLPIFTNGSDVAVAPANRVTNVQDNQSFLGLSLGAYDPATNSELAAAFGLEFQPGFRIAGFLQPLFGAMVTHEGSYMGYAGIGAPIEFADNWMLMPSAALGYYDDNGDGVDLGQHLVYRLGTELAYVFENKSRLGLNAHVITNGDSFDSDDRTEVISLVYTMPIGDFGLDGQ